MSTEDRLHGIRVALELAMLTRESVNVGLNQGGQPLKIEGVILRVFEKTFRILLEDGNDEADIPATTVPIADVEYVEYS